MDRSHFDIYVIYMLLLLVNKAVRNMFVHKAFSLLRVASLLLELRISGRAPLQRILSGPYSTDVLWKLCSLILSYN